MRDSRKGLKVIDVQRIEELYKDAEFVKIKGSNKVWLALQEAGGLTLLATWMRNDVIEGPTDVRGVSDE
jgi:hypothetical protein